MAGIIGDWTEQLIEKWRILYGKEGEWSDLKFGAPRF
jgi:hypothetical protein